MQGFAQRHLGPSAAEQHHMLERLGCRDLEQLLQQGGIPDEFTLDQCTVQLTSNMLTILRDDWR